MDIGKERVERFVAGESHLRAGDDALQEISLFARHYLCDQKATTRVATARQHRVHFVSVHEAGADLKKITIRREFVAIKDARPCPRSLCSGNYVYPLPPNKWPSFPLECRTPAESR